MIYSPTHGLLFLKTMKTAGTSIEIELSRHMRDDAVITPIHPDEEMRVQMAGRGAQNYESRRSLGDMTGRDVASALWHLRWPTQQRYWSHITAAEVRDRLPQWDDVLKVCVVRNPWDVLASRFHMERVRRRDIETVDDLIERIGVTKNWPIYTIDDEVVVDEVIRYECLADDLPEVLGRVNISVGELPRAKSGGNRAHHRDVLEPRHVEMVAKQCHRAIEMFGFEP